MWLKYVATGLLWAGVACHHSGSPSGTRDGAVKQATKPAMLSPQSFRAIKALIIQRGDRQTYCNMVNNNPHLAFEGFDVFLNPDVGQTNLNCNLAQSDFNELVIRDWRTQRIYFLVKLDLATEALTFDRDDSVVIEGYFRLMLSGRPGSQTFRRSLAIP